MTTIYDQYIQCTNCFKELANTVESQSCISSLFTAISIADLQKQFNEWAETVGALTPPHRPNSLDSRLAPKSAYSYSLSEILIRLKSSLTTATQLLSGDKLLTTKAERTTEPKFERHPDSDSDEASTTSSTESSRCDEADTYNSINLIISKLRLLIPTLSSQGKQTGS
ncbi:uncharacterized protein FPRO_16130 [Fusarium proliferatum ET1]|uniref:Uncharacterized protein n=1 Tax=Fusarium proliferatum (strain ET1) TaxID=1227346 RepID=A0A1L7WBC6_FUSPR|nr:uncharacterized protein FPRO_16130 [Fusarium proliferatum ET1]CZR49925.1 uncharacterized protein FPRO_16130 [Fusarium proliferatum ET1]